jgi:hypothetical protein
VSTVYVSVDNSDDKLSQQDWFQFVRTVFRFLANEAHHVHGEWFSVPDSRYQNACVCVEFAPDAHLDNVRETLAHIAEQFEQDAIAWAVAVSTQMIGPRK